MRAGPDLTPLAVICELTYRCPLKCVYCSNPLEMAARDSELALDDWKRVLTEARALGALQAHLTGVSPPPRRGSRSWSATRAPLICTPISSPPESACAKPSSTS